MAEAHALFCESVTGDRATRFGKGALRLLDAPSTWAMVLMGALAGSVGCVALGNLSRGAVTAKGVDVARRGGQLTKATLGRFVATRATEGTAFHTGMNLFEHARHKPDRASWGLGAYARSVALFQVLGGVQLLHHAQGIESAVVRHAVNLGEETVGLSLLGLGECWLRAARKTSDTADVQGKNVKEGFKRYVDYLTALTRETRALHEQGEVERPSHDKTPLGEFQIENEIAEAPPSIPSGLDPRLEAYSRGLMAAAERDNTPAARAARLQTLHDTVSSLWPEHDLDTILTSPTMYLEPITPPPRSTLQEFHASLRERGMPEQLVRDMVLVDIQHYNFAGQITPGQIGVHSSEVDSKRGIFRSLRELKFPMTGVPLLRIQKWV